MKTTFEDVKTALQAAVQKAGNKAKLSRGSGVKYGLLCYYLGDNAKLEKMSLKSFFRLFPEAGIDFFNEKKAPNQAIIDEMVSGLNEMQRAVLIGMICEKFNLDINPAKEA